MDFVVREKTRSETEGQAGRPPPQPIASIVWGHASVSLMQKPWIAPCSAGLPTGVDRVEGSQDAHQEMGATIRASFETVNDGIFARGSTLNV